MPTAIVTGASRGLGLELARSLVADGWRLVIDGREAGALERAALTLGRSVRAVPGDVAHRAHRRRLVEAAGPHIDLVVNNASALGPTPMPTLADIPLDAFARVHAVNLLAPLELVQLALPRMAEGGVVLNISSDAAVEAYPGWGAYGSAKAALDHVSAVLALERPDLRIYAVDPGDMDTRMHAEAFPGEDHSDLPGPERVAPALVALAGGSLPSGRYLAADVAGALT